MILCKDGCKTEQHAFLKPKSSLTYSGIEELHSRPHMNQLYPRDHSHGDHCCRIQLCSGDKHCTTTPYDRNKHNLKSGLIKVHCYQHNQACQRIPVACNNTSCCFFPVNVAGGSRAKDAVYIDPSNAKRCCTQKLDLAGLLMGHEPYLDVLPCISAWCWPDWLSWQECILSTRCIIIARDLGVMPCSR